MTWFYEHNREQKGPVSDSELDVLIANGQVLPTTLVWREGLPAWQPLQVARPQQARAYAGEGGIVCDSCGGYFPTSEVINLGGRNICAQCKPVVLQGLQQGDTLAGYGEASRTGPAWEQRETLGTVAAAWQTVKDVMMQPSATFSTMRCTGGIAAPFTFYLLVAGLGQAIYSAYYLIARGIFREDYPNFFNSGVLQTVISAVLGVLIGAFIQSAVVHVCLKICGGARRPFETTFRALAYGNGAVMILNVVPVVGNFAAVIWGLVVAIIGLARSHEITAGKAALAIFLPAIVCCIFALLAGGMVGFMGSLSK